MAKKIRRVQLTVKFSLEIDEKNILCDTDIENLTVDLCVGDITTVTGAWYRQVPCKCNEIKVTKIKASGSIDTYE